MQSLPKREARILGVSSATSKDEIITVGVVYRGSLWLDGIVCSRVNVAEPEYTFKISRTIEFTKQFPQLHAVMLSRELNRKISISELYRMTGVPVLATYNSPTTSKGSRMSGVRQFCLLVNGKPLWVMASGIRKEEAERLYNIGCSPGSRLPEAVRVARILSERLRDCL